MSLQILQVKISENHSSETSVERFPNFVRTSSKEVSQNALRPKQNPTHPPNTRNRTDTQGEPSEAFYRVLTSNRGEGDKPLWRIGPGTRMPLRGAVDVVPLLGAIVVHYGRAATCHCWVPLQGAIVVWYDGGNDQLWGSGLLGAIVVCCGGEEGRAMTNFLFRR